MARPAGNRGMWLLKITSKHHSPERLAWAVALGVLLGLVPKLNLLAPCLMLLVFCLPVHSLLAIATSCLVTLGSRYLDPLTARLGEALLTQPMLGWLWATLDEAPVLPWLALNNTVVLGSFLCGLVAIAPAYMLALRLFEFFEYDYGRSATEHNYSSVPTEHSPLVAPPSVDQPQRHRRDKLTFTPGPAREAQPRRDRRMDTQPDHSPLPAAGSAQADKPEQQSKLHPATVVIPPPKLIQSQSNRAGGAHTTVAGPDEPIEFEPIDDVRSIINSWHMNHNPQASVPVVASVGGDRSASAAAAGSTSKPSVADNNQAASLSGLHSQYSTNDQQPLQPNPSVPASEPVTIDKLQHSISQFGAMDDLYPQSTWRGDVMTTMEVVQNASQTLQWVDELLDECLADHGITVVSSESGADWEQMTRIVSEPDASHLAQTRPQADESEASSARWLMETTIEIVRWAEDDASSINNCDPADCDTASPRNRGKESSQIMQPLMTRETPNASGAGELNILPMTTPAKRSPGSSGQAAFQHLVMAGATKSATGEACKPVEPLKGECLGYLLGHLKQAREGKSS